MSTIAAHIGDGINTFLVRDGSGSRSLFHFPYSYNPTNFAHSFGPEDFYFELFSRVSADYNVDLEKSSIVLASSFPRGYFSKLNIKHFSTSSELSLKHRDMSVVYAKRSLSPDVRLLKYQNHSSIDILSNMCLYRNVIPNSLEDNVGWGRDALGARYYEKSEGSNPATPHPVLFTGPAFTGPTLSLFFKYSLAFTLLPDQGLYEVYMDENDFHLISSLLEEYEPETYFEIKPYLKFSRAGHLAKFKGPLECLIKKEYGEQQLTEVCEEDLFVFPIAEGENIHVFIKGRHIKDFEVDIDGGDLGFIVDTRISADTFANSQKSEYLFPKLLNFLSSHKGQKS